MITITVKGEIWLVFRALHQPLSRGSFCLLIVRIWYSGREEEDDGAGSLVLGSESVLVASTFIELTPQQRAHREPSWICSPPAGQEDPA